MECIELTTSMVAAQVLEVGLNTLIKATTNKGMSDYVFIVYSNAMALSLLLPSSFLYYMNRRPRPITTSIICKIFLLSLLTCVARTLKCTGIGYSSPVLASVMADLSPAYTLFLAFVFRYEKRQVSAKCFGTVLSIIGALMVTLYRGSKLKDDKAICSKNKKKDDKATAIDEWLLGGILLALGNFCISLLLNVKTWIMKEYPEAVMTATISCSFVVMLSTTVALIAERNNAQAWTLRPDMELAAILFSGIIKLSMKKITHTRACREKGPVYVAVFTPFGMVIALAMGHLFLGESPSLGSVIGGGIISIGFHEVLWGQAQQEKMACERKVSCGSVSSSSPPSSSSDAEPLLQNQWG